MSAVKTAAPKNHGAIVADVNVKISPAPKSTKAIISAFAHRGLAGFATNGSSVMPAL